MESKQNRLIHHFLEESARVHPDKCALVHGDIRLSYDTLNRAANRLALWLIDHGMTLGDRAVLLLENCQEYVVSYYGVLKAGGTVVSLNPELKPDSLQSLLTDVAPQVVIASTKSERLLQTLDYATLPIRFILIAKPKLHWENGSLSVTPLNEITGSGDSGNPVIPLDGTDLASIIFTSGSTGKPKGVMLSHRNIVTNTRSITQYLDLTSADIQMVVLPFFYVMGKSLLNTHIAVGGTVVINNRFAYPASVIQQMVDEQVTGFSGVPSTFAYLLHRSPLKSFRDKLGSLRYCSQAGGHLARHTKEELLKALPEHTKMFVMYGATEASARLTYVEPERIREKIDSIGIPIPHVTMRVLDEKGLELPTGETGELVASGANIMLGYWKDPDASAKALSRNGYHTGDMGYQDEDGYFHVVGRKDNQLKVGGHRVDPQEIEDALISTELVIEVAVLGLEDTLAGHRLVALTVPIDMSTTERDILLRCSRQLPRHKLPGEIRFVKSLPKNSSGKTDRGACTEMFLDIKQPSAYSEK
jgi:acyl-CoA synthetase (AMP-forming)/AMP-acid ligase II